MSGKLDQSLDEIMKDTKPARQGRGRGRPRKAAVKAAAAVAPTGGVTKKTKAAKVTRVAATPAVPAPTTGESKIIVSNLPEDVNEAQIKDYFGKTVGSVKRVMLTYGPQGRSRGIATIIFSKPGSAADAAKSLNGVKVDNKSMKIEVVVGAQSTSAVAPKNLSERITKPKTAAKDKPKAATAATTTKKTATTNGTTKAAATKKKAGRAGRPKAKTAEELDAEMQDYFGGNEVNGAANNGAAAPATNGDAMDDIS